jgi:hypothetical protein
VVERDKEGERVIFVAGESLEGDGDREKMSDREIRGETEGDRQTGERDRQVRERTGREREMRDNG